MLIDKIIEDAKKHPKNIYWIWKDVSIKPEVYNAAMATFKCGRDPQWLYLDANRMSFCLLRYQPSLLVSARRAIQVVKLIDKSCVKIPQTKKYYNLYRDLCKGIGYISR